MIDDCESSSIEFQLDSTQSAAVTPARMPMMIDPFVVRMESRESNLLPWESMDYPLTHDSIAREWDSTNSTSMNAKYERRTQRVRFPGGNGFELVGIRDYPDAEPIGSVIYSSCFTCGKDLKAAARICRALAQQGVDTLRFDFTGLGDSSGSFADTNFTTNCRDIRAAAEFMSSQNRAPSLLIGHSLGGAASLAVAGQIESVAGVATIAAPSDTAHLADNLARRDSRIRTDGIGSVEIGGRSFQLKRQLLEDLQRNEIESYVTALPLPVLILHSRRDETLAFEHGRRLFEWAGGPASFVELAGADHLLVSHPDDVSFVADLIGLWAARYVFASI